MKLHGRPLKNNEKMVMQHVFFTPTLWNKLQKIADEATEINGHTITRGDIIRLACEETVNGIQN